MMRRKSADGTTAKPVQPKFSLARAWGLLGGYAALLLLAVTLFAGMTLQATNESAQQQQAQHLGEAVAMQLAVQLRGYTLSLEQMSQNVALVRALQTRDQIALSTLASDLQDAIPRALRVRIMPPGVNQPDEKVKPPFGYAALELLRQAEKKPAPEIEMHLPGQSGEHIAVARRVLVPGGEEVLGVIYAALDPALLDSLNHLPDGVALRLEQRAQEKPVPLRSVRTGDFGPGSIAVPVAGTLWQIVAATPGNRPAAETLMVWLALGAGWLLLALGGWVTLRFSQESFRRDQVTLVQALRATLVNNAAPSYSLQWQEMLGLLESVQALARDAVAGRVKQQPAKDAAGRPGITVADGVDAALADVAALAGRLTASKETAATGGAAANVPTSVFLRREIGGPLSVLTPKVMQVLGQAIGSEAQARGAGLVIIACDYREASPTLAKAVREGLQASGVKVVDLGPAALPVWQFATHFLPQASGVWVGASQRDPLDSNGLRIVMEGQISQPEVIQALAARVSAKDFMSGSGSYETQNLLPEYIGQLSSDVPLARMMKVVVDGGYGLVGQLAPMLLRTLGCDVIEINCDLTPAAYTANPTRPETLIPLARRVREEQADLGLAFDADGDRLGVVDSAGEIIWIDTLLMLFAADVLARQPGVDIIYDVECTRHLAPDIVQRGGRPVLAATGWAALQEKLREGGALLAGGLSGHVFFKERWYGFADALYAAARLLEILSVDMRPSQEVFTELPRSLATPQLRIAVPEAEMRMSELQMSAAMILPAGVKITTLDGVRAEFEYGWGVVRASHSAQEWVLRFEADDAAALARVQQTFRELLGTCLPDIQLPF